MREATQYSQSVTLKIAFGMCVCLCVHGTSIFPYTVMECTHAYQLRVHCPNVIVMAEWSPRSLPVHIYLSRVFSIAVEADQISGIICNTHNNPVLYETCVVVPCGVWCTVDVCLEGGFVSLLSIEFRR